MDIIIHEKDFDPMYLEEIIDIEEFEEIKRMIEKAIENAK